MAALFCIVVQHFAEDQSNQKRCLTILGSCRSNFQCLIISIAVFHPKKGKWRFISIKAMQKRCFYKRKGEPTVAAHSRWEEEMSWVPIFVAIKTPPIRKKHKLPLKPNDITAESRENVWTRVDSQRNWWNLILWQGRISCTREDPTIKKVLQMILFGAIQCHHSHHSNKVCGSLLLWMRLNLVGYQARPSWLQNWNLRVAK